MSDESMASFSHTVSTNSSAWVVQKSSAETFYTTGEITEGQGPSKRLIDAIARGEVTRGGLAEAGWFEIGTITEDGVKFGDPRREPGNTSA